MGIKETQHVADTSAVLQDQNSGPKHLLRINHTHQQMHTTGLQTVHKFSKRCTHFGAYTPSYINVLMLELLCI
jgi:hypothetical protein